jgi:hypothetical protein
MILQWFPQLAKWSTGFAVKEKVAIAEAPGRNTVIQV